MGAVNAREQTYPDDDERAIMASPKNEQNSSKVALDGIQANVKRVHVEGLVRTKEDVVAASIEPVLKVKHFEELVLASQDARNRLQDLGCFSDVEIHIDTSEDGGKSDYEVTFAVKELRRIVGSINTMVGNQEGSVITGVKFPNILGRGERFQVDYTHGSKKTSQFNASFSQPIRSPNSVHPTLATLTSAVFQQTSESIASGYKNLGRGVNLDLAFLSAPQASHLLRAEAVWRELTSINSGTSFAVREHCGHTLKTALQHILTVDRRDDPMFPNEGSLFRLSQEFAGAAGDIGFFKNELEVQANLPVFFEKCVLQSSFQCGLIKRLPSTSGDKTMTIADKLFLGGPLSVRGFDTRGLGPSSGNNALGGEMYWATGLHLYTPMPFGRSSNGSGFSDLFRTHTFITAGNLLTDYTYKTNRGIGQNLDRAIRNFRLSYGVGLALRLGGIARIELNYCVPIRAQTGDKVVPGLQLGVGVNFL